jgi:hypothetical protein
MNASLYIKYTLGALAKGKNVKDTTVVRHKIKSVRVTLAVLLTQSYPSHHFVMVKTFPLK